MVLIVWVNKIKLKKEKKILLFDFIFVCSRDLSNNQIQSLHEDALKGVSIETM